MSIRDALRTIETQLDTLTIEELEAMGSILTIASVKTDELLKQKQQAVAERIKRLHRAKHDPDRWVCRIVYRDSKGERTRRTVSPTRFWKTNGSQLMSALDIGREESRAFTVSQIESCELVDASEVLMGEETVEVIHGD